MKDLKYEKELQFAKAQWDKAYSDALNGNVDKNALYLAMTSLNAIHGPKIREDILHLERSWRRAREVKEDKYEKARRELKEDCERRLREYSAKESVVTK